MTVLILCAHPDDEIFGVGATIAKYSRAGEKVIAIVFSSGESSNPILKKEILTKIRKKEIEEADKILGISKTVFLGLPDARISQEFKKRKMEKDIINMIRRMRPYKIFTHSIDDPHPDHRAVYNIASEIVDKMGFKGDVYSFDVWNPVNVRHRDLPKMYVNVSDTFKLKIKALKSMKSQKMALFNLLPGVYFSALKNGLINRCRYAERFIKIR